MARHEIAARKLVYDTDRSDSVSVRRGRTFRMSDEGPLDLDLYYPPDANPAEAALPAVVFVLGYADAGARARLGCAFKEMESFIGWARLVAASGAVAVAYGTSRVPADDAGAVLRYVRDNAAELRIDPRRIAVWACSGHGPTAMSTLMADAPFCPACAVLYYAYTLDLDGAAGVADAARTFNFANPVAGRSVADLADGIPTLIVRAGLDEMPQLNAALDRMVMEALARNLPLTVVNHATGSHAFDLVNDDAASRRVIRQTLAFLREQLRA